MTRPVKVLIPLMFLFPVFLFSNETLIIKAYHVFESFGTETQELKNSIVINYNERGLVVDSTIYSHNIPLGQKYIYIAGPNEGLKLKRSYDKEMILSFKNSYDKRGNRVSTSLFGTGDSIYWKQYQKYDKNDNIIKRIRYNPSQAVNPEMLIPDEEHGDMLWGESYSYDSSQTILHHKEYYNDYILSITIFELDSSKSPIKKNEYFDPSVIFQTIFFHNDLGQLIEEKTTGRLGNSIGSKKYKYDLLGRRISTTFYNEKGIIEKIYDTVFDDDTFKTYDYYSDSIMKLGKTRETLLDNQGRTYIEAILDGKEKLLEKNVYYYDQRGRITETRNFDMVRRGKHEHKQIPIRVNKYKYD